MFRFRQRWTVGSSLLAGLRALIVEDEVMIVFLLEGLLEDLGCVVAATAARPAEALAVVEAEEIDFAVLDVNLDGETSYGVADALAARRIPFVFSTGYGSLGLKEGYRDATVLAKPFDRRDLERALKAVLTHS